MYTPVSFLIFHFLHSFFPLYRPVYFVFQFMRCYSLIYTGTLVPVHLFLVPEVGRLLLHAGLLLVKFLKASVHILIPFFKGYNFVPQDDLYCFAEGEGQTHFCCSCIQLVGHSLQCSRCHSLASCCNVDCQIIGKE